MTFTNPTLTLYQQIWPARTLKESVALFNPHQLPTNRAAFAWTEKERMLLFHAAIDACVAYVQERWRMSARYVNRCPCPRQFGFFHREEY